MSNMNKIAEKLADFIEKHPNCFLNIDNDSWYITKSEPTLEGEDVPIIADDSDYYWDTNWYSNSSNYGAGLAEALLVLLNRRGFNIKSSAV